jgi:hypothetical protein
MTQAEFYRHGSADLITAVEDVGAVPRKGDLDAK